MNVCDQCQFRLYALVGICPWWKSSPGVALTGGSHCLEGWVMTEGTRTFSELERFKEFQCKAKLDHFFKDIEYGKSTA
jgi:hypothetical protein